MDDTKKGEGGVNGWMDKHQKKENPTFRSWGWSCSEHLIAPFFFLFFLFYQEIYSATTTSIRNEKTKTMLDVIFLLSIDGEC